MPASSVRLSALIWSILLSAVAGPASSASPYADSAAGRDQVRESRIRAALEPDRTYASQVRALERRRAPDSVNLFLVGCDFSDSLMYGRDPVDFPGWPPQRRQSQRIPGTDIPVFAAHDATYFDLQMQRVRAYFSTVSFGAFDLRWAVHPEIVNVPRPMGYFADRDSGTVRLARMAQDLATALDPLVDFGPYDTFVLVHAGAGSETDVRGDSPEQIGSNYLDSTDLARAVQAGLLPTARIVTAEREFEHVLVLPESETQDAIEGVPGSGFFDVRGVYCYEVGLRLGMLSLADFTPSNYPDSQGIGNFGLMGYGLFTGLGIVPSAPSAINRMLMGWARPVDVLADADLRIAPMLDPATAVTDTNLVRVPITDREYWLVEYRLQDPDGDLFYGFDDLNGNLYPDYFDQSNAAGGGIPNSTFDPAEDAWEDETGAEVDFFMSENPARSADGCDRGGGSGLYVWHVDEQVIENALRENSNTINADASHKGVDLEEADGIQDLDSARGSAWLLGGDDDVWRGEGASTFGPDTNPSTLTAAGIPTGIRFTDVSKVVVDTLPRADGFCTGFEYAPAMRLRVEFGAGGEGPLEQARWRAEGYGPQFDLRVVDLGSDPGNPAPDGRDEIVALADGGRVIVLSGDLSAFGGAGTEPATLAVAVCGDSVRWAGPAAVVDFDDDGRMDLFAGANAGIFGFDLAGDELLDGDGDPATRGRLADPQGRGLSPVIVDSLTLVQSVQAGNDLRLVALDADAPGSIRVLRTDAVALAEGGAPLVVTGPGVAWAAFEGAAGSGRARFDYRGGAVETDTGDGGFGASPVVVVDLPQLDEAAIWIEESGRLVAGSAPAYLPERSGPFLEVSSRSAPIVVPASATGTEWVVAFVTADALWAFDANLTQRPGFPARMRGSVAVAADARPVEPVAIDLDGDGRIELVWCDGAGGLHATDLRGRELPGWPVQGPATPVSAPAIGQFDADPALELAVAGRFEKLVEASDQPSGFVARTAGEVRVYETTAAPDAFRPWPQAAAAADNRAWQRLETGVPVGRGLAEGTFSVRPNPARGPTVRLRVEAAGAVRARLEIFTVEGERVLSRGPFSVPSGTALDETFDIGELVSGTYVCQVTAGDQVERALLAVVR